MLVTKEALFEGKTIDDAINAGLAQLSLDRDSISVEVVATPVKGIFGIGGSPAKIKISYEVEERVAPTPKAESKPAPVINEPGTWVPSHQMRQAPQKNSGVAQQKPVQSKKPVQSQKPVKTQKPQGAKQNSRPPRAPEPVNDQPFVAVESSAAQRFLGEVFGILDMKVDVAAATNGHTLRLDLNGESMGMLIGRHGETLDAFQYLTSLVENNSEDSYEKVYLDIQGYRAKREETLVALAHRVADKVKRFGKNVTLEAMNPYERRIIHSTLQEVENISTFSTGFEPNRKIVVTLGDKKR